MCKNSWLPEPRSCEWIDQGQAKGRIRHWLVWTLVRFLINSFFFFLRYGCLNKENVHISKGNRVTVGTVAHTVSTVPYCAPGIQSINCVKGDFVVAVPSFGRIQQVSKQQGFSKLKTPFHAGCSSPCIYFFNAIQGLIQFDIVEAFGRCICQHQMSCFGKDLLGGAVFHGSFPLGPARGKPWLNLLILTLVFRCFSELSDWLRPQQDRHHCQVLLDYGPELPKETPETGWGFTSESGISGKRTTKILCRGKLLERRWKKLLEMVENLHNTF